MPTPLLVCVVSLNILILLAFVSSMPSQGCGRPNVVVQPDFAEGRIVGGKEALLGQFPWQVSIQAYGTHFCGATIIHKQWLVTAAHCMASVSPEEVMFVMGTNDISTKSESEQKFKVKTVLPHEKFDRKQLLFDIALVKVDKAIKFTDRIQPVCLPTEKKDFDGAIGTTSGWGKNSEISTTGTKLLNYVQLPIMSNSECQAMFLSKDPPQQTTVRDYWICAGFKEGGKDACQGDSGGPFAVNNSGIWELAGVVTGGFGCARAGTPGLFTRVPEFVSWIHDKIAKN